MPLNEVDVLDAPAAGSEGAKEYILKWCYSEFKLRVGSFEGVVGPIVKAESLHWR